MNVDDLHRKRPDHSFRNRDQKTGENDQIGRKLLQFPKECLIEPLPRLIIFRGKAQRRYTGILRARQRVRAGIVAEHAGNFHVFQRAVPDPVNDCLQVCSAAGYSFAALRAPVCQTS